jgi:hypothetical protein
MTRADLDYLINGIVSGLGGRGGVGGTGIGSRGTYRNTNDISINDFEREEKNHNRRMVRKEYEGTSEINKYLKEKKILQEELNELQQYQLEIQEKLNNEYADGEEILERIRNGSASDEDKRRAEEMLQLQREKNKALEEEYAIQQKLNNSSFFGTAIKQITGIIRGLKNAGNVIEQQIKPWTKIDDAASKYVKTLGMTKAAMDKLSNSTLNNINSRRLAQKYNIEGKELIEAQANYIKGTGRKISINNDEQESIAALRSIGGESAIEFASQLDRFGVNVKEAEKRYGKMFATASREGLNLQKYAENVTKNIKIAQNYTFKNGLKGLESMAKKATAMKLDMQQVANFADKVTTVEGAIDVASRLQVLGGPFASMADPISLMNEGLLDMEGLYDRVTGVVSGMGTFNKELGQIKFDAFEQRLIRQYAEITGISREELTESANAQARRRIIGQEIEASPIASKFSNSLKELIKNTGSFENGKVGVNIGEEFIKLENINEEHRNALLANSHTDTENLREIAVSVRSIEDKILGRKKSIDSEKANIVKPVAETVGDVSDTIGFSSFLSKLLAWGGVLGGVLSVFSNFGGGGMFRRLFSRGKAGGTPNAKSNRGNKGGRRNQGNRVKPKNINNRGPKPTPTNGTTSIWGKITTQIREWGTKAWTQIKNVFGTLGNWFSGLKTQMGKWFSGLKTQMGKWLSGLWKGAKGLLGQMGKWLSGLWGKAKGIVGTVGEKATTLWGKAKGVAGTVGKKATTLWSKAKGITGKAGAQISKYAGTAGKWISKNWAKFGKGGSIAGIAGAAGDIATDIAVENDVIKKGSVEHYLAKMGSNALAYGGTGASVGGGHGAVIGAIGGAWKGAW